MEKTLNLILDKLAKLEQGQESLKQGQASLKQDVLAVKITQENEIAKNISIIAEGHTILNKKLNEALKLESETNLLQARLTILENTVKEMQEQSNKSA